MSALDILQEALAQLRTAEDVLDAALRCGDTHEACAEALALIRDAIGSVPAEASA